MTTVDTRASGPAPRGREPRGAPSPLAAVAAILALALGACADEPPPTEPARLVDVTDAVRDTAVDALVLLGDVQADKAVQLVAETPEKVAEVHVEVGDVVAAGDPLVTLDPRLLASDLAQARAAEKAARASRDRLGQELARVERLVGSGAAAQAQLERLETELRGAEAQVEQLAAAQYAAGRRRARSTLRAPFDGVVARLAVEEGDLAAPQMPVAEVVQMDRVKVVLQVAEPDFVRVEEGMEVEVRPPALPDVTRSGTVTRVSPVLDRLTRTGLVEVSVDNADHVLRPGMVAEVSLTLSRREDVVMVPGPAIVMTPDTARTGQAALFVVDGDVARRRTVTLGPRYGDRIEIAEGVAAGEPVVVRGQHLLRNGSPIRVNRPATIGPDGPAPEEAAAPGDGAAGPAEVGAT